MNWDRGKRNQNKLCGEIDAYGLKHKTLVSVKVEKNETCNFHLAGR